MTVIEQDLKWEMARICVDDHAQDGLERGTLVQILYRWEEDLSPGAPSLGQIVKVRVKSLTPPYVVKDINGVDVA